MCECFCSTEVTAVETWCCINKLNRFEIELTLNWINSFTKKSHIAIDYVYRDFIAVCNVRVFDVSGDILFSFLFIFWYMYNKLLICPLDLDTHLPWFHQTKSLWKFTHIFTSQVWVVTTTTDTRLILTRQNSFCTILIQETYILKPYIKHHMDSLWTPTRLRA